MADRRSQRGFTLVELMVTIAVLAILMAIAAPSFADFMRRNEVTTDTNDFLASLRMARSTAITRNLFVAICPSSNPTAATPSCTDTKDYATGYIIYVAPTPAAKYAAGYELLRVNQGAPKVSMIAPASAKVITFTPRGASSVGAFSVLLCAKLGSDTVGKTTSKTTGRSFNIQVSGRIGVAELAGKTGSDAGAACTQS